MASAAKYLQKRLNEVASGKVAAPDVEGATIGQLVQQMFERKDTHQDRGWKTLRHDRLRWGKNLAPVFEKMKARKLTDAMLTSYISTRQKQGAANGTINREIGILQRAFTVAKLQGPAFKRLPEAKPRPGFLPDAQRDALLHECGKVALWLRAMVATAATFGFRRGEMENLRVSAVDLPHNLLRLEASETKTGEARQVKLTPDVRVLLEACIAGKDPDALVFDARNFRRLWEAVCKRAGVPDLLFHDLRRTAVRNMIRAGIPERAAMMISGHKTRSMLDRYNVVSEDDLEDAAAKLHSYSSATVSALSGNQESAQNEVKPN